MKYKFEDKADESTELEIGANDGKVEILLSTAPGVALESALAIFIDKADVDDMIIALSNVKNDL